MEEITQSQSTVTDLIFGINLCIFDPPNRCSNFILIKIWLPKNFCVSIFLLLDMYKLGLVIFDL